MAPVRLEICHCRWKKSNKPLGSKMRQISLGINQSYSNRFGIQIVPQFYSIVFDVQTVLCMILHGIVLHDFSRHDEWVRVVANISGWRICLSQSRFFSGFVTFRHHGKGLFAFFAELQLCDKTERVLGKIAHFKSCNNKFMNVTKNIHKKSFISCYGASWHS